MAVRLPHARVLHTEYPEFLLLAGPPGQCLLVWDRHQRRRGEDTQPAAPPEDVRRLAASLDVGLSGSEPVGVVEAPFLHNPTRVRHVHWTSSSPTAPAAAAERAPACARRHPP